MANRSKNELHNTYGRWYVFAEGDTKVTGNAYRKHWWCRCTCGSGVEKQVNGKNLRSGMSKSCGCLQVEQGKRAASNLTYEQRANHGKNNPFYGVTGEDHPSYNPDRTDEERNNGRNIPGYRKFKEGVKDKYDNTCVITGEIENLHTHHLLSYNEYPDLRVVIKNGVPIVNRLHREMHRKYGDDVTIAEFLEFCEYNGSPFNVNII